MTLTDLQTLASTDEGREKIRVMVAERVGWREDRRKDGNWWLDKDGFEYPPNRMPVPDYVRSLDACAEFEAGLSGPTERLRYAWNLRSVTNTGWPFTAFASAPHRCIAFILLKQSSKGAE